MRPGTGKECSTMRRVSSVVDDDCCCDYSGEAVWPRSPALTVQRKENQMNKKTRLL